MSSTIDRMLDKSLLLDAGSSEYRSFLDSGGRLQTGSLIALADGALDGFLYNDVEDLRLPERNQGGVLEFQARGTSVTIQGTRLKLLFKANSRHTLIEIHEPRSHEQAKNDQPTIERLAVTPPRPQALASLSKVALTDRPRTTP